MHIARQQFVLEEISTKKWKKDWGYVLSSFTDLGDAARIKIPQNRM